MLVACAVLIFTATAAHAGEIVDVASRGERTRLLIEGPANPSAVVVLFAGGHGALGLGDQGEIAWGGGNFLVRSRGLFQRAGFVTALIDAPTDRLSSGLLNQFRSSEAHAEDVGAAIRVLREKFHVPVWLIGTSRGTNSVANAAIRLESEPPDGIVLTSSMLRFNRKGPHLLQMDLHAITLPVLIVHHVKDACNVTPFEEVPQLEVALSAAKTVAVLSYEGGSPTREEVCGAYHYHGFRGIEKKVISDISDWILSYN
jgi:hypothetical protein